MTSFATAALVFVFAYLAGSIPTALIVSTHFRGLDIRTVGDGNMGARNAFHEIGPGFGVMIAAIDFSKGAVSVLLAHALGLSLGLQMTAGIIAILGHDFPVFAGFRGGQGTAATFGTMLVLFPWPLITGLVIFGLVFLVVRNFNISCGIGGAAIALILAALSLWALLIYAVSVFLMIPAKKLIDTPRRRMIQIAQSNRD